MPDFLVSFRHNTTNALFDVRVCNVDEETTAIKLANNSLLNDEDYHFDTVSQLSEEYPELSF